MILSVNKYLLIRIVRDINEIYTSSPDDEDIKAKKKESNNE